jgi:hypothetical protein
MDFGKCLWNNHHNEIFGTLYYIVATKIATAVVIYERNANPLYSRSFMNNAG